MSEPDAPSSEPHAASSEPHTASREPLRYAVVGNPVRHSLSPMMQQAAFAAAKISATYEAINVEPQQLATVVARLRNQRYAGWNVTTPLKEAVLSQLDALTIEARETGAVNVVRREPDGRLTGHNTDGAGLAEALVELWAWQPERARILLLGSGPAARAIAYALRQAGAVHIACWSRNEQRAFGIAPPPVESVNLVISALPSSAQVPASILHWAEPVCDVVDVNYSTAHSPVGDLHAARRSDGLPMLLHQGALSFEWWTGLDAPLSTMRLAIRV